MGVKSGLSGRFVRERGSKKIHVSELQIGMWVWKLDRDWLETPFLMQGFFIESMADIARVAEFCQYVWVDIRGETWSGGSALQYTPPAKRATPPAPTSTVTAENKHIIGTYRDARRATKSLLESVSLNATLDTVQAKQTVRDCVHSVLRNPDALMWLSKIRSQDEYTSEHCLSVCIMAIAFGRALGYPEETLHDLGVCGLLHDVGKMRVPLEILNKPGRLTDEEMRQMQRHTVYGRNLLQSAGSGAAQAVDVAWSHHEQPNGKGYPRGLAQGEISHYAQVIAIVDAYDAMTADRCYKKAMTSTEALKIIFHGRGTQFNRELAEAFLRSVGLYPPGSIVELVNGSVGLVFETNHQYRQLPKLILMLDNNKQRITDQILDLADVERGKLGREFLIRQVHTDGAFGISVRDYQKNGIILRDS